MSTIRTLTTEEVQEFRKQMVKLGTPVRFMADGCAFNVITGHRDKKGINVIHQTHYWNFTRETAKQIAALTGTNPIFSE